MKMMSLLKEDVSKYTNAGISKFAVAIASLTATRADAVQKFADTNELNIEKLYQFLKRSKLDGKMDFVTALVGKPGNPIQKKMIKMFSESVNEEEIKWNAVENAIINFLKMNTKILDKRVQAKDTDGVKSGLKSIISGLTNAQRSLKLESVNEGRAFINAAKKAKLEGKTEFEFNGKKYPVTLKEGTLNEDPNMNKKVKALLDKELKDLSKGRPNHLFAVMHILMGALTDANFHSDAKKVPSLFPKAKYEGDPMAEKDLI